MRWHAFLTMNAARASLSTSSESSLSLNNSRSNGLDVTQLVAEAKVCGCRGERGCSNEGEARQETWF